MPTTPSGIYWESQGPVAAPAVLLIEGYTGQLIGWRDAFCDLLLAQVCGFCGWTTATLVSPGAKTGTT
ncbi:hypothetical protein NtRootD5_41960 (plasmid) [Arthrobacter sp. NtRootD5]|nr:hypothetical protein NtRootD5_41960 [Arthrobacter sp. NtRootD5]